MLHCLLCCSRIFAGFAFRMMTYEGRPINKLQNGIILLIYKIWKIRNIGFVRNLIVNNICEFYYDDVTVTSFVNDKIDATAESIPYGLTCQVLNVTASYEYQKNECVQQWNCLNFQTPTFYYFTYCPNLLEHLLIQGGHTVWETRLLRSLDQSLKQHIGRVFFHQQHFLVHKQTSYTKHVLLVL